MNLSLLVKTDAHVIAIILFLMMICFTFTGYKIGRWKRNRNPDLDTSSDLTYMTALLFFLLAFTFGMSGSRYDRRRVVVIEEANSIGTALLRADLYPAAEREHFRKDFQAYVEARIMFYQSGFNIDKLTAANTLTNEIGSRIWKRAAGLSADPSNAAATFQMIPALNAMIDITTTRLAGENARVPESILYMLFFLSCITAFYGGYVHGCRKNIDWLVESGFCLLVALVVLFTLDLDRPRRGMINLDEVNKNIIELRKSF
jgi:hypothetical protein